MTTVKMLKVGHSLMLCVPRWFTSSLKLQRGDVVAVELDGHSLKYTPIRPHMLGVPEREHGPTPERADDAERHR